MTATDVMATRGTRATGTRGAIVAGAYRALVRRGSQATSIDDIAREAGVARGLVHYYFGAKEALLLAAIEHACEQVANRNLPTDPFAAAHSHIEHVRRPNRALRSFYRLLFDVAGAALHNPRVAATLRAFFATSRANLEAIVAGMLETSGGRVTSAPAITTALYGAVLGIALQRELDPSLDAEGALDALEGLLAEALGRRSLVVGGASQP